VQSFAEVRGRLTFAAPGGDFTLTATADRIDLSPAGRLAIIDYKTGSPPTQKAVVQGIAPQLPLEAAIAKLGGFDGIAAADPESLAFWKLSGGAEAGKVAPIKGAVDRLADDALAGLKNLVAAFDNPETPYPAVPRRKWELRYNDYAHLARLKEWAQSEDGEDGGAS
jgi:ATP-dependent helicase/nuclease subunit B